MVGVARNITIRVVRHSDLPSIVAVHESAFETPAEAKLVQLLHQNGAAVISLVAAVEEEILGHILFSPVSFSGLGLAPVAVRPKYQGQRVGSQLIDRGLAACRSERYRYVCVLGEPGYYSRFGFKAAHEFGLRNEYSVKDEFMVQELVFKGLPASGSLIQFANEFRELSV